ncbi:ABC transporter permease [Oceanirhabdus sp. W0125-5]|uniref:ABC transporter permease n=1 Tax=Oceanirhabdus sp. W0125-5 TaxID=2999116 RepID=UPI0022F323DE|nr:hypothetical protein [Oceanirhabdus sp. W0125-5]WBW94674.1 hypothetical protein OW730_13310 [Oceanirhabdus sp. W0125-5]
MNTKKSWLDKGLIINDLKRYWWAMALFSLGMIFFVVFPISTLNINEHLSLNKINKYLFNEFVYIITIGVSFLVSILVFSFMNRKGSSEFIYSLPLTKKTIFLSKYLSGLLMIVIPSSIAYLLVIVIMWVKGLYSVINILFLIKVILLFMLISVLSYTITTAISMLTSSSIAAGVFSFIYLYLPSGLKRIVESTLSLWIYGYTGNVNGLKVNNIYFGMAERLNPLSNNKVLGLRHLDVNYYLTSGLLINFLLCILGYLIISYILFNHRKSEAVGNMIAFKWFRPILKYGFTLCIMITSLLFLQHNYIERGFGFKIGVYLITSAIAYCIAVCFIEKSVSGIFKKNNLKGLGIYSLIVFIGFYGVWNNIFGIQELNVNASEVEYIHINLDVNGRLGDIQIDLKDKELIKESLNFKDYLMKNRNKYLNSEEDIGRIEYIIVNKGELSEWVQYDFNDQLLNHDFIQNLYVSKENKSRIYGGVTSGQDVNYIKIAKGYDAFSPNRFISEYKILDRNIINQLTKAIKEDVDGFELEDLMDPDVIGRIKLFGDSENEGISITITNSYKNTINKLKELNLFDKIYLSTDEIEKIEIYARDSNDYREITVTEQIIMEELIKEGFKNEYDSYYGNYSYSFNLYLKDGRILGKYILIEDGLSEKIKELLIK